MNYDMARVKALLMQIAGEMSFP